MPLFNIVIDHWLLFVADLNKKWCRLYDLLLVVQWKKAVMKCLVGRAVRKGNVHLYT